MMSVASYLFMVNIFGKSISQLAIDFDLFCHHHGCRYDTEGQQKPPKI